MDFTDKEVRVVVIGAAASGVGELGSNQEESFLPGVTENLSIAEIVIKCHSKCVMPRYYLSTA